MARTEWTFGIKIVADADDNKIPQKSHEEITKLDEAGYRTLAVLSIPPEFCDENEHGQAIVYAPIKPEAQFNTYPDGEGNVLVEWSISGHISTATLSEGKKSEIIERKSSKMFAPKKTTVYTLRVEGEGGSFEISKTVEVAKKKTEEEITEPSEE